MFSSVHGTKEIDSRLFSASLCRGSKTVGSNHRPLVGSHVLHQSHELLDTFHIHRFAVVLAIDHDQKIELTGLLTHADINLSHDTGDLSEYVIVRSNRCVFSESLLNVSYEFLKLFPLRLFTVG